MLITIYGASSHMHNNKIRRRMLLHRLKSNDGNTEVIPFIYKHNNTKFDNAVLCPFRVGSNNIIPESRVRNLSVIMSYL